MSRMTQDGLPRSGRGFIVGRLTTPGRPASVRASTKDRPAGKALEAPESDRGGSATLPFLLHYPSG
jgi:hypothetical protein